MPTIQIPKVPGHPSQSQVYKDIAEALESVVSRLREELRMADDLGLRTIPNAINHMKKAYGASMLDHWNKAHKELGREAPVADIEARFLDTYAAYVDRHSQAAAGQVEFMKPERFSPKEFQTVKAIAEICAKESAGWRETVAEFASCGSRNVPSAGR